MFSGDANPGILNPEQHAAAVEMVSLVTGKISSRI
jgi:hypothetical protein